MGVKEAMKGKLWPSGCAELCSGKKPHLLWAGPWCLWDWASLNRKNWPEWSNIAKGWVFLLPVPSLENKLNGIISTVIFILDFCLVCFFSLFGFFFFSLLLNALSTTGKGWISKYFLCLVYCVFYTCEFKTARISPGSTHLVFFFLSFSCVFCF